MKVIFDLFRQKIQEGDIYPRRCPQCGKYRVDVTLYFPFFTPNWEMKMEGPLGLFIQEYVSQSGKTYFKPRNDVGTSCCLGYGRHGKFVYVKWCRVVPASLFDHLPYSEQGRILVEMRDIFFSRKGEYLLVGEEEVLSGWQEKPCYLCRKKEIAEMTSTYSQGHLSLIKVEEIPQDILRYSEDWEVFNHQFSSPVKWRGEIGGWEVGSEGGEITSSDHDPIFVGEGKYILYHPYPQRGGD